MDAPLALDEFPEELIDIIYSELGDTKSLVSISSTCKKMLRVYNKRTIKYLTKDIEIEKLVKDCNTEAIFNELIQWSYYALDKEFGRKVRETLTPMCSNTEKIPSMNFTPDEVKTCIEGLDLLICRLVLVYYLSIVHDFTLMENLLHPFVKEWVVNTEPETRSRFFRDIAHSEVVFRIQHSMDAVKIALRLQDLGCYDEMSKFLRDNVYYERAPYVFKNEEYIDEYYAALDVLPYYELSRGSKFFITDEYLKVLDKYWKYMKDEPTIIRVSNNLWSKKYLSKNRKFWYDSDDYFLRDLKITSKKHAYMLLSRYKKEESFMYSWPHYLIFGLFPMRAPIFFVSAQAYKNTSILAKYLVKQYKKKRVKNALNIHNWLYRPNYGPYAMQYCKKYRVDLRVTPFITCNGAMLNLDDKKLLEDIRLIVMNGGHHDIFRKDGSFDVKEVYCSIYMVEEYIRGYREGLWTKQMENVA